MRTNTRSRAFAVTAASALLLHALSCRLTVLPTAASTAARLLPCSRPTARSSSTTCSSTSTKLCSPVRWKPALAPFGEASAARPKTARLRSWSASATFCRSRYSRSRSGGLFIPADAGVRPGNYVTFPTQTVDRSGNINIPFAGSVRASGRTANGHPARYRSQARESRHRASGHRHVPGAERHRRVGVRRRDQFGQPIQHPPGRRPHPRYGLARRRHPVSGLRDICDGCSAMGAALPYTSRRW